MQQRAYSSGSYRYGFNGKENDNDVKGTGIQVAFEARIYDPRLGKFLSPDPKWREAPHETPYAFAGNSPIENIDEMGENPRPAARGRRGRGGGGLLTGEGHALGAEELARFREVNSRNQVERDRAELARNREIGIKNPELYRALSNWKTQFNQYSRDAFETMGVVFAGGTVQDRKKVGDAWGNFVGAEMLKNPNYIGVAKQITIHIVGTVNGQQFSAKVRVDNVGVVNSGGKGSFALNEAKYSVQEITVNNVKFTLTEQQSTSYNIIMHGTDVRMYMSKGVNSPGKINTIMKNSGLLDNIKPGEEITGRVNEISISAPSGTAASASNSNKEQPKRKP